MVRPMKIYSVGWNSYRVSLAIIVLARLALLVPYDIGVSILETYEKQNQYQSLSFIQEVIHENPQETHSPLVYSPRYLILLLYPLP